MLADEYRYKRLQLLESNPQASRREFANALGISRGKGNYCLNALIERGLVKARNFAYSRNKRAYMYDLTPRGPQEKARVTVRFFRQQMAQYGELREEIETLRQEAARAESRLRQSVESSG